jgi:DNA polymerase III subunit delta
MKIAPRQIATFLNKPPAKITAVLFHGNDLGMISERAKQFAHLFSDNLDDVFSVTRLTGDMLPGQTGLIADSAAAIPAFGDRRVVLVKGHGTELLEACKLALTTPLADTIIIVEASQTTTKHAIVKLFETSKNAASIGCYADNIGDIRALATSMFAADQVTTSRDALDIIVERLGSDRASSRIDAHDVHIALGDNALLAIDDIADALASGAVRRLQQALQKAWYEDANAVMIIRGCQSYFQQLGLASHAMAAGQSAQNALRSLRPPPHFKLQDQLQEHLRRWRPDLAMAVVNRLQDIELQLKTGGINDQLCTAQSLLGICLRAPR